MHLIDSNLWTDVTERGLSDDARLVYSLIENDDARTIWPVVHEVARAKRMPFLVRQVAKRLARPGIIALRDEDWIEAAVLFQTLRDRGHKQRFAVTDLLLGVVGTRLGAVVLTNDIGDFTAIANCIPGFTFESTR